MSPSAQRPSSVQRPRLVQRLLVLALATLIGVGTTLMITAAPASAHGQFVSSDPAKDSQVAFPIASILVYFTEKPTSNAFFSVTAPSGARVDKLWSHGTPRHLDAPVHEYYHNPDGEWETRSYDVAYPALIPIAYWPEVGAYKVTYLSVATDGEPVRGEFAFTYSGAVATIPNDYRPQKNEPDPNLLAVSKTDQPTAPPSAGPAATSPDVVDSGPGVWIVLIPVGVALIVAFVIFVVWRWRPEASQLLVSRFGGRYAAPLPPRKPIQLPAKLQELQEKLPTIRRK